ncbi:MAG: hypothetical protein JXB33_01865 [Clostridia bacterium]|nr:hypothetical protein [Clostridia bacterium]
MSYDIGMAAINLEMPERIPRSEYSAELYFDLMKRVTGIDVCEDSPDDLKLAASLAFRKVWNYDFNWNVMVDAKYAFKEKRTKMGHAKFTQGGLDYTDDVSGYYKTPEEVLAFDPFELFGEIDVFSEARRFEDDYKKRCAVYPEEVNMTGIYVTCVSGLIDLFGWDMLLLAAGLDSEGFGQTTNRYSEWIGQYFKALALSDVPVAMVHDDLVWTAGPFIHPDWYRKFVFPNIKKNLAPLKEAGKKIMFTSDGNFNKFITDIADCGVDGFIFEPITDLKAIADRYGKSHVIIGNADTRIIMFGSRDDIHGEVRRCMDIGRKCPGFFMAIGNHISPNSSIENLLYYNECYEKMSRR